jgi:hypothetical protein
MPDFYATWETRNRVNVVLFGSDILHKFLQRVSLAKATSAPLRFLWLRGTHPLFASRGHPAFEVGVEFTDQLWQ